jgi:hypothetical protein
MHLVGDPPETVGALALALGLRVEQLVPHGMYSMGSIQGPGVSAEYEWDMYHEPPVETLGALAGRRLVSFRVSVAGEGVETALRARFGEPREGRYGPFACSSQQLEWHAAWPVAPGDAAVLAARIAAAREPGPIALEGPVPAAALAAALGHPEAVARTVDVHMSSWRIEPLTFGDWEVDAMLERAPAGPPLPSPPATGTRALDPEVLVQSVSLRCGSI